MKNMLRKMINTKVIGNSIMLIYLISLIPIIWLGNYNYPSIDDFSSGAVGHITWENTHSLFSLLCSVTDYTGKLYLTWTGDFFTTFFTILTPIVFGEEYSKIVPVLMLGVLTCSVLIFFRTVFVDLLGVNKYDSRVITFSYLLVAVQCIISGVDAFFWYTGAINYIFPFCMLLLLLSLLLQILFNKKVRFKAGKIFLLALLEFLMGGGSYIVMINLLILNFAILLFFVIRKRYHNFVLMIVMTFFFLIGAGISVFAPGNMTRQLGTGGGFGIVKSIFISFHYCLLYVQREWTDIGVIIIFALIIPFVWHIVNRLNIQFGNPFMVLLFSYCLLSSSLAPSIYGTGNISSGRIQNLLFLEYILLLLMNEFYILGWIAKNINSKKVDSINSSELSFRTIKYVFIVGLFGVFAFAITIIPEANAYTTSSAVQSLVSGEAKEYGNQVEKRINSLRSDEIKDIKLEPFSVQPHLLYLADITDNASDWENIAVCKYYQKHSVVLKNQNSH